MQQKDIAISLGKAISTTQYILSFFLWIYIIYRGLSFEITQDEAYSYFLVKTNYWKALPGTYNTHWLNTVFMKFFLLFPGEDNLWKLRMLSMLSWPLFAFSVIKTGQRLNNKFLWWLFFVANIFNPFLISYFGLARGYAISCALLAFSLWQVGKLIDSQEVKPSGWIPVFLPAALAVFGNFSLLYFFFTLSITYFSCLLIKSKSHFLLKKSSIAFNMIVVVTIFSAVSSLLFIKYYTKEAEFGAKDDLIFSFFASAGKYAGYLSLPVTVTRIYTYTSFIFLLVVSLLTAYRTWQSKKINLLYMASCCCILTITINALFHFLFHSFYLSERTILFFYFPFLLVVCLFFDQQGFIVTRTRKILVNSFAFLFTLGIVVNFYFSINLTYLAEWPVQSKSKEALDFLASTGAKKVGLDGWQFSVLKNYYSKAFPDKYTFAFACVKSFDPVNTDNINKYDYIVLSKSPKDSSNNWQRVLYFPAHGTTILKFTGKQAQ